MESPIDKQKQHVKNYYELNKDEINRKRREKYANMSEDEKQILKDRISKRTERLKQKQIEEQFSSDDKAVYTKEEVINILLNKKVIVHKAK